MNEKNFEKTGKTLLIAIGVVIFAYFVTLIVSQAIEMDQKKQLSKLQIRYHTLQNELTKKEIDINERKLQLLNLETNEK